MIRIVENRNRSYKQAAINMVDKLVEIIISEYPDIEAKIDEDIPKVIFDLNEKVENRMGPEEDNTFRYHILVSFYPSRSGGFNVIVKLDSSSEFEYLFYKEKLHTPDEFIDMISGWDSYSWDFGAYNEITEDEVDAFDMKTKLSFMNIQLDDDLINLIT